MRERCDFARSSVNRDAPHEKAVTLSNHFGASAELNSPAGRPLNSKRYEAFRSTAIERKPMSRSDCRP